MAQPLLVRTDSDDLKHIQPTVVSQGTSSAGQPVALGSDGLLDETLLPVGVGPDVFTATATEALSAGNFVNCYGNSDVFSARKADNSNGRPAHGFVLEAVSTSGTATIYPLGESNTELSGLTVGASYWLGTAGSVIAAPLASSATGKVSQRLGLSRSATELVTVNERVVLL